MSTKNLYQESVSNQEIKSNRKSFKLFVDKTTFIAALILLIITLIALTADFTVGNIFKQARDTIDTTLLLNSNGTPPYPPGVGNHLLGTDELVRDVLARTIYAGQVSLSVGYLTAIIVVIVGGTLGFLAGYFGGWVDSVIDVFMQILVNIPVFFLMVILSFIVRFEIFTISLLIGLLNWVSLARLIRGQVLSLKQREYIEAAKVMGASNFRIMRVHLLPSIIMVLLPSLGFTIASAILQEAGLSFLGFGVVVPIPSWGNQIAEGTRQLDNNTHLFTQAPWLVLPPACLMVLTILSLYLVANGLRDAFDLNVRRNRNR